MTKTTTQKATIGKFHRVVFVKNFLTGTLAGLQYRCCFDVDVQRCADVQRGLMYITEDSPAADALTGTQYFVTGIGCEEVPANDVPFTQVLRKAFVIGNYVGVGVHGFEAANNWRHR